MYKFGTIAAIGLTTVSGVKLVASTQCASLTDSQQNLVDILEYYTTATPSRTDAQVTADLGTVAAAPCSDLTPAGDCAGFGDAEFGMFISFVYGVDPTAGEAIRALDKKAECYS